MCPLSRLTSNSHLEEEKGTSQLSLFPLWARRHHQMHKGRGSALQVAVGIICGTISSTLKLVLGLMIFLQQARPSPSSVPKYMALTAGTGCLWSPSLFLSSSHPSALHLNIELMVWGRAMGNAQPFLRAGAGLIHQTCLWQILCLRNIITFPVPTATCCLFYTKQRVTRTFSSLSRLWNC